MLAQGNDVLSGTTGDATATIKNSGKKWLYLIEVLFSHAKRDNQLKRNYLKGTHGDKLNALLNANSELRFEQKASPVV